MNVQKMLEKLDEIEKDVNDSEDVTDGVKFLNYFHMTREILSAGMLEDEYHLTMFGHQQILDHFANIERRLADIEATERERVCRTMEQIIERHKIEHAWISMWKPPEVLHKEKDCYCDSCIKERGQPSTRKILRAKIRRALGEKGDTRCQ